MSHRTAAEIREVLTGVGPFRLHHGGSTAVGTIWAKDIVDIYVETAAICECTRCLVAAGWRSMYEDDRQADLNFGYTPEGFAPAVFHLHIRKPGACDELYFRDYLMDHPDTAKAYEALKLSHWKQFEHDRDGYTAAKSDFIRQVLEQAKALYGPRYEWDGNEKSTL